jgi:hypothetical protein
MSSNPHVELLERYRDNIEPLVANMLDEAIENMIKGGLPREHVVKGAFHVAFAHLIILKGEAWTAGAMRRLADRCEAEPPKTAH